MMEILKHYEISQGSHISIFGCILWTLNIEKQSFQVIVKYVPPTLKAPVKLMIKNDENTKQMYS